jgi:hypothetical protein
MTSTSVDQDTSSFLDPEDVYAGEGEDFTGDVPDNMDNENIRVEGDVVHFVNEKLTDSAFPVSLFNDNDNPEADVPEFLKANNIKYKVDFEAADSEDYESTDQYTYTFGESSIEIAYNTVVSAVIYSPLIELNQGVKVGMSKADFIAVFGYLQEYQNSSSFQLHTSSPGSACYWIFEFDNEKVSAIKLKIFIQDCG